MFKISALLSVFWIAAVWVFAANPPEINCGNLPWCASGSTSETETFSILWNVIATGIQYVAVIAVITVMIGWIMYLISSWEEEKVKKAKNVIIWSLAWVFISMLAWSIINLINNFRI